ncbi:MAG TPA: hypothetical protein VK582_06615 [Pyrinomonadaceae bacterium]|nr:hypothetical protein [Pyrinomonadaceae bacterium]
MTEQELVTLWEFAAAVDPGLRPWRKLPVSVLQRKRLRAGPYSRSQLFSRMTKGQPSLFTDFPVSLNSAIGADKRALILRDIKTGFPARQVARTQIRSARCVNMRMSEFLRRWEGGRSVVSVTDLHFRETRFEKTIDTSALSDFNILCGDPDLIENLEMMTMVISSKRNLTDTHTDDCDGSNHCFLGKKLWLSWDRIDGRSRGFQDVDRDKVSGLARFDLRKFLSLPNGRWFVVKENETLFLPGSLSHKVITLEDYLGVGSFHVALPSYVRALRRWILYDTMDVQPYNLLERINRAVIGKIRRLQKAPRNVRERWGLPYLRPSIERWRSRETASTRKKLLENPTFLSFLNAAQKVGADDS